MRKIVFALVSSWLLVSSSAVHAFDIVQITDNGTDDRRPAISGSTVVWQHCDGGTGRICQGGDQEIYQWDGSFPIVPIRITDNDDEDWFPAISGSNVVWQKWDGNDFEIYFWDGSFPIVPIQITDNSNGDEYPAISGSNVVWQHCDGVDYFCDDGDTEIYFWDGSFPVAPTQITSNLINDRMPAISGSNVVWEGYEDVLPITAIDVYFWDGSLPITPIQITDNSSLDWRPDISGSTVVWTGMFDGTQQILRWDGSFPVVPTAVSDGPGGPFLPAISGSNVVWQQGPFDGTDIYFSNGVTSANVSNDSNSLDEFADISGSTVVWEGCLPLPEIGCPDDEEIYMATIPTLVPSISFGGLALLAGLVLGTARWLTWRRRFASA